MRSVHPGARGHQFPVVALNGNIMSLLTDKLGPILAPTIMGRLNNNVEPFDREGPITDVASVGPDPLNPERLQVRLSEAFCQYLWLLIDVTFPSIDAGIVSQAFIAEGQNPADFYAGARMLRDMPRQDALNIIRASSSAMDAERMLEYLIRMANENESATKERRGLEVELCGQLLDDGNPINWAGFESLDLNSDYSVLSNGVYIGAVAAILLHEFAHAKLDHFAAAGPQTALECEADEWSWNALLGHLTGNERFTAACGVLMALFTGYIRNPALKPSNTHPRADVRIFDFLDRYSSPDDKLQVLAVANFKLLQHDSLPGERPSESLRRIRTELLRA